jgi:hypothetical protein
VVLSPSTSAASSGTQGKDDPFGECAQPGPACLALALQACLVIAAAGLAQPVRAATFLTVSTCDDNHLRAAVAQANSDNADDMILFACSGTYPSDCTGAADPNYVISYAGGVVTVTPAATVLADTGPQSIARGTSFAPAATLSSPASACRAGQPVSFTLNVNPKTAAARTYPLESATTDGTGAATGASVSTSGWQAGAYTITVSYAGTADCGASASTKPLVVAVSGLKAAGTGSYPVPGAGTVSVDFAVIGHTSAYHGGITLVSKGNWRLTGTDSGYTKSSATQGTVTGTGTLSWWNPSLNSHHGGWQLAGTGVAFTASFTTTTTTSPGSFGIQISYTPVPPQPSTLPNSSRISLRSGIIVMA